MLFGKLLEPPVTFEEGRLGLGIEEMMLECVEECMDFIEYADKYGLREVGDAVYQPLKTSLEKMACQISSKEHTARSLKCDTSKLYSE